jgi:NAD(P)-dependent dehydrogenase (short-subunit alcohol dehydrogenase family)
VPSRRAGSDERRCRGRCGTAIAGQELRLRLFHCNTRIRQLHHEQTRQAENIRRERATHCAPRTGDLATAIEGSKALLDYSMTKGGIHRVHEIALGAVDDRGIRVNAVAPGPVWQRPEGRILPAGAEAGPARHWRGGWVSSDSCSAWCVPETNVPPWPPAVVARLPAI